jgi:hypothetical protein
VGDRQLPLQGPADDADLNLGVIAQQVAESCPEVITVFEEAKDDQPEKLGVKEQQMYWQVVPFTTMSDDDWLEPLDRRIEEVRRETEAIRKANAALKRLYDNNHEGMKRLADS